MNPFCNENEPQYHTAARFLVKENRLFFYVFCGIVILKIVMEGEFLCIFQK